MYVLKHKSGEFYCGQNLYMGTAITTKNIDEAEKMNLNLAERNLSCMSEQVDWKIFRVETGFRLAEQSLRHEKIAKKKALEQQIRDLGDI